MTLKPLRRTVLSVTRRVREVRMVAKALQSPRLPILVHIIPVRRCNLSCTYCNEYDDFSKPVRTAEMLRRIDLLAALGAAAVHLSGPSPKLVTHAKRLIFANVEGKVSRHAQGGRKHIAIHHAHPCWRQTDRIGECRFAAAVGNPQKGT